MPHPFHLRGLAAALVLASAAFGAQAADRTVSGHLGYNTDVVQIAFDLAIAGDVLLWTDSWQDGLNIDPTLSVFDDQQHLLVTGDDTPDPATLLPGQGGYDSQIRLPSLAAGHYLLTLSASGNDPLGATLADGFSLAGTPPVPIADWDQPSHDINKNDQKGDFWQVHLSGVDAVAAPVPEPDSAALLLGGLLAMAVGARRRRG